MSFGEVFKVVGRTDTMLKEKVPPGVVVTGSPASVTAIVMGLKIGGVRLLEKRRTRAPVEGGLVTVPVGIGKRILTWPFAELIGVTWPAPSVRVICEAEEMLGALR